MLRSNVSTRDLPRILKPTDLPDPDLKNDVDPIFATLVKHLGGQSHPAHPALRLASLLLAITLPIFHSILSRKLDTGRSAVATDRGVRILPEPKTRLTEQEQKQTRSFLQAVAHASVFEVREIHEAPGANGLTMPRPESRVPGFPGYGAKIVFDTTVIETIATAHTEGERVLYFAALFSFARCIVHEYAHAAEMAFMNLTGTDEELHASKRNFIGDALTDEQGYELEKRLFGGLVQVSDEFWTGYYLLKDEFQQLEKFQKGKIVMFDWPYWSRVDKYQELCSGIRVRTGTNLPEALCAWDVPVERVAAMFSEKFWSKAKLADTCLSQRLLRFPRETGQVYFEGIHASVELYRQALAEIQLDVTPREYGIYDDGSVRQIIEQPCRPVESSTSFCMSKIKSVLEAFSRII